MSVKIVLYERGCGKWVRFHDVPQVQFTSNRAQASRIYEEGGASNELIRRTIEENKLSYLMKTIVLDFDMINDDTGEVMFSGYLQPGFDDNLLVES